MIVGLGGTTGALTMSIVSYSTTGGGSFVFDGIGDADLARLLSTVSSGSVFVGKTGLAATTGGFGFTTAVYRGISFSGSWYDGGGGGGGFFGVTIDKGICSTSDSSSEESPSTSSPSSDDSSSSSSSSSSLSTGSGSLVEGWRR